MFPYQDDGDWCHDHCCLAICLVASRFLILAGAIVCITLFLNHIPYSHMKFYVNGASLTEFYLTDDNILHYNLAVNISVRNSNKVTRIFYHRIRSNPSCYGKDLPWVPLPSFHQGTRNTSLLHPVYQGQTSLKLRGSRLKDFNYDQRDGSYSISVYLYLETQLKLAGGGKGVLQSYIVNCGLLRLHLLDSSTSSNNQTGIRGLFKTKRCQEYPRGEDDTYY
ncbi:hypothetical protein MKW92_017778 [Papaver armeniacum]|nr:hypothetical protein MKW92_017778 [Papaver armeniacum]